ncbi:MAG: ATP-dependent DNA helicase RecG [Planctomycetota bacterium]
MTEGTTDYRLSTPLEFLPGAGAVRARKLSKLGLRTVGDLLFCFPRNYEFPAPPTEVTQLAEGQPAAMVGVVTDAEIVSRPGGKSIFAAVLETSTGSVRLVFFNQPYRAEQIGFDMRLMISGTPKLNGMRWEFVHPKVTILEDSTETETPQILPIYPLTEGVKQSEIRRLVKSAIERLAGTLPEVLPAALRDFATEAMRTEGVSLSRPLCGIGDAISAIHYPADKEELHLARSRFVLQELLVMQLALAMRRRNLTTELRAASLPTTAMMNARIINRFPFEPTADQRRAFEEIADDLKRQFPMNRLLQGDVGSGKTVVAIYAMMVAVGNQYQAVLMAPTEVLARQHFQTLSQMLSGSRVEVGLLCGSLTREERRNTLQQAADGRIDLLVGTQALLHGVEFDRLGLCVIDEQHKFGVRQRVRLRSGGVDPHYLVMSATPIPRSVAMTLFGDTELTTLREKPSGRGVVKTYLGRDEWRSRWWGFVRQQLAEGRQAFVVAPRVNASQAEIDDESTESEATREDVASVQSVFEDLKRSVFPDFRVGLLHGRLPNEEKQDVMKRFAAGDLDVLVTTTVIEVGIDVSNATVMTILGAQQFGLATLHQLRGRVARSAHTGHVCVFTDGEHSPEENERLQVFEQTSDGFELAEADFKLRGPGDVLGSRQSGLPPMRIADLHEDAPVLYAARAVAQHLVDEDPELADAELSLLRKQVLTRYGKRLELGDAS